MWEVRVRFCNAHSRASDVFSAAVYFFFVGLRPVSACVKKVVFP